MKLVERALAERLGLARRGWAAELDRALTETARRHRLADAERDVASHPALLREVAERLSVPESHFFRHPSQLEVAVEWLSRRAVENGELRIWSAGCSRGEEAYSLLALLHDASPWLAARARIIGTDLSRDAIGRARGGVFGAWSLRGTSSAQRARHFDAMGPDEFRVRDHLHGKVEFTHDTVQERLHRFEPHSLDLVLFRNVGIYWTREALFDMLSGIQSRLVPGGLLLMAPTDPLPTGQEYPGLRSLDVGVYQVQVAATPPLRPRTAPPRSPRRPSRAAPRRVLDEVQVARHLADRGSLDEALAVICRRLQQEPGDERAHFFRGQVLLAQNAFEPALGDFQMVRSDRFEAAVAEYFASMCLSNLGRTQAAVEQLRRLERRLSELAHDQVLHAGYTAEELLSAVQSDLKGAT